VYTSRSGNPCAVIFFGQQVKPVANHCYPSESRRERAIREAFEARRKALARAVERRAERSKPHTLEVGHVLSTCWGYEQTNREFFEVTRIVGPYTVELREIAQFREPTAWEQGTCLPQLGNDIGDPIRRRARADALSVTPANISLEDW
jgi:hypothetical protein